jgi:tetrahydromethanopterin S-methyltransferase subunit F
MVSSRATRSWLVTVTRERRPSSGAEAWLIDALIIVFWTAVILAGVNLLG